HGSKDAFSSARCRSSMAASPAGACKARLPDFVLSGETCGDFADNKLESLDCSAKYLFRRDISVCFGGKSLARRDNLGPSYAFFHMMQEQC
ncbi:MAG: hypothetical protein ACOCVM_06120, partial [Desulfovibrionaceae bacterium]